MPNYERYVDFKLSMGKSTGAFNEASPLISDSLVVIWHISPEYIQLTPEWTDESPGIEMFLAKKLSPPLSLNFLCQIPGSSENHRTGSIWFQDNCSSHGQRLNPTGKFTYIIEYYDLGINLGRCHIPCVGIYMGSAHQTTRSGWGMQNSSQGQSFYSYQLHRVRGCSQRGRTWILEVKEMKVWSRVECHVLMASWAQWTARRAIMLEQRSSSIHFVRFFTYDSLSKRAL